MTTERNENYRLSGILGALFIVPIILSIIWTGFRISTHDNTFLQINPVPIALPQATADIIFNIENTVGSQHSFIVSGWAVNPQHGTDKFRSYLILTNTSATYAFKANQMERADVSAFFRDKGIQVKNDAGMECAFSPSAIKPGIYCIGMLMQTRKWSSLTISTNTILITNYITKK